MIAAAGLGVLTSALAHAQGMAPYNYAMPSNLESTSAPFQTSHDSFSGYFTGFDGALRYGSVNTVSMNLGDGGIDGVHHQRVAGAFLSVGIYRQRFRTGFSGAARDGGSERDWSIPPHKEETNATGRVSFNLGGGLSMNVLGGMSNGMGNGFYYGPGRGFSSVTTTSFGTGFSMNVGHGTLNVFGGVSRTSTGFQ